MAGAVRLNGWVSGEGQLGLINTKRDPERAREVEAEPYEIGDIIGTASYFRAPGGDDGTQHCLLWTLYVDGRSMYEEGVTIARKGSMSDD